MPLPDQRSIRWFKSILHVWVGLRSAQLRLAAVRFARSSHTPVRFIAVRSAFLELTHLLVRLSGAGTGRMWPVFSLEAAQRSGHALAQTTPTSSPDATEARGQRASQCRGPHVQFLFPRSLVRHHRLLYIYPQKQRDATTVRNLSTDGRSSSLVVGQHDAEGEQVAWNPCLSEAWWGVPWPCFRRPFGAGDSPSGAYGVERSGRVCSEGWHPAGRSAARQHLAVRRGRGSAAGWVRWLSHVVPYGEAWRAGAEVCGS
jgi:hypothetical protein